MVLHCLNVIVNALLVVTGSLTTHTAMRFGEDQRQRVKKGSNAAATRLHQ